MTWQGPRGASRRGDGGRAKGYANRLRGGGPDDDAGGGAAQHRPEGAEDAGHGWSAAEPVEAEK